VTAGTASFRRRLGCVPHVIAEIRLSPGAWGALTAVDRCDPARRKPRAGVPIDCSRNPCRNVSAALTRTTAAPKTARTTRTNARSLRSNARSQVQNAPALDQMAPHDVKMVAREVEMFANGGKMLPDHTWDNTW